MGSCFCVRRKEPRNLRLIPSKMASRLLKYAYDLSALKALGIDVAASDFTALVHFRGSW